MYVGVGLGYCWESLTKLNMNNLDELWQLRWCTPLPEVTVVSIPAADGELAKRELG